MLLNIYLLMILEILLIILNMKNTVPEEDFSFFPYKKLYSGAGSLSDIAGAELLDSACKWQYGMDKGVLSILSLKETTLIESNIRLNNIVTSGIPSGSYHFQNTPTVSNEELWTNSNTGTGRIVSFVIPSSQFLVVGNTFKTSGDFEFKVVDELIANIKVVNKSNSKIIIPYELDKSYNKFDLVTFMNTKNKVYFRNDLEVSSNFDSNTWKPVTFSSYPEVNYSEYNNSYIYIKDSIVKFENKLWKALKNINSPPGYPPPDPPDSSDWKEVIIEGVMESYKFDFYTLSGNLEPDTLELSKNPTIRIINHFDNLVFS